jgi:hypothetical protein
MKELINILKKFEDERAKRVVDGKWVNDANRKDEAVAECFKDCAKDILCNGYFLVNNKYIIDLGAIELYYHEETGSIKDYAMYHIPERYQHPNTKVFQLEKDENNELPYFKFGSFNLHQFGVDVTFENPEKKYRASFLIRSYRVLKVEDVANGYPSYVTTDFDHHMSHIFDDMFYEGFSTPITWMKYPKGVTIEQATRKNLKNKKLGTDKKGNEIIVTLDEDDTRLWQFKLKGLDVNNSK